MSTLKGNLSINSENIFPIIKKWLYSDHDIFFRELISNGCDAITKLKKLEMIGEAEVPEDNEYRIQVIVNSEEKSLTFIDNGIGMTADEVNEYIEIDKLLLNVDKDNTYFDYILTAIELGDVEFNLNTINIYDYNVDVKETDKLISLSSNSSFCSATVLATSRIV